MLQKIVGEKKRKIVSVSSVNLKVGFFAEYESIWAIQVGQDSISITKTCPV